MAKSRENKLERKFRKKLYQALIESGISHRYRKNHRKIPGTPDIFFPKLNYAIFIHGCFWHGHGCKYNFEKSDKEWENRQENQRYRDEYVYEKLNLIGIEMDIVWECEINNNINQEVERIIAIVKFLS